MGSQYGDFRDHNVNEQQFGNELLSYDNLFNYKEESEDLTSLNLQSLSPEPTTTLYSNLGSDSRMSPGLEFSDDSDSDDVFKYIREMLMEEDMEQKPCMFHDSLALQAAERPFYDVLGTKYPHSPNQHPLVDDHFVGSPDDGSWNSASVVSGSSFNPSLANSGESCKPLLDGSTSSGSMLSSFGPPINTNIFSEKESILQFQRGMEEASKFLPKNTNFVIDIENMSFPDETEEAIADVVKTENNEDGVRGSKIHYREDDEFDDDGRSCKQSAFTSEEADATELSEMFDKVLLCPPRKKEGETQCKTDLDLEKESEKDRLRKDGNGHGNGNNSNNTVDLRTLLILCAQSVASDDRRTADELLKQIREHSSDNGDGSQRLAYYFAKALEARLAGTGSQIYTALSSKRTTAADMIKAYQFFLRTSPFKKISIGFSNLTILKAAENKSKLHVIDFGILYGFQWPILIQLLSERHGGPPKLCITGIDLPQPGFRPAERVEATGRRLANYCQRFKVPFEYHAIAKKWETIKLEDLKIENDEVIIVNCLHRFKNLLDETIMVDSPRSTVLNLIRTIKPDIFIHGVVNGSYNAPFFVTRFREALFHYSTLFDMFDANASQEDPERYMFEKEFYGREIMNVVACEGTERVERPETYKQWQVRNNRAGFRQHKLDPEIMATLMTKVKAHYHKDFVIDVDGQWALIGWKGRISYAITAWAPT